MLISAYLFKQVDNTFFVKYVGFVGYSTLQNREKDMIYEVVDKGSGSYLKTKTPNNYQIVFTSKQAGRQFRYNLPEFRGTHI